MHHYQIEEHDFDTLEEANDWLYENSHAVPINLFHTEDETYFEPSPRTVPGHITLVVRTEHMFRYDKDGFIQR